MECGARLPAEAHFCNICGTRVVRAESAETPVWQAERGPESDVAEEASAAPAATTPEEELASAESSEPPDHLDPAAASAAAAAAGAAAATEDEERKWVWGDQAPQDPPEAAAVADETTEMTPAAAIDPGEEIVETRRYPPRQEVRREDLDEYRRAGDTQVVEPYYEEAGLGIRPGILMATIGFAIALAGVFFPWVSIEGADVSALDDSITATIQGVERTGEFPFQIQDALDSDERLDGYIIIGLSAVGIFFLFLEYVLLRRIPIGRVYAALGGLAVGALGVVELLYIRDVVPDDVSFSYEPGLFMVTIGGAAAIVGSLIPVGSAED